MLVFASIQTALATIVCLYFRGENRGRSVQPLQRIGARHALSLAAICGMAGGLALAVLALGWAAGIGLWLAGLMVAGVAVVSLAGSYPELTRLLGCCSAAISILLTVAHCLSS